MWRLWSLWNFKNKRKTIPVVCTRATCIFIKTHINFAFKCAIKIEIWIQQMLRGILIWLNIFNDSYCKKKNYWKHSSKRDINKPLIIPIDFNNMNFNSGFHLFDCKNLWWICIYSFHAHSNLIPYALFVCDYQYKLLGLSLK